MLVLVAEIHLLEGLGEALGVLLGIGLVHLCEECFDCAWGAIFCLLSLHYCYIFFLLMCFKSIDQICAGNY